MVKKKTVDSWGIKCIKYTLADDGETVLEIYCGACREYYSNTSSLSGARGFITQVADKFVKGTSVIKKNNALDHVSKSSVHRQAVMVSQKEGTGTSRQSTLTENVRKYTLGHRAQLVKKFQLAHFIMLRCRPFKDYEILAKFEKDVHKVDLGTGYLSRNVVPTMATFLAEHVRSTQITDPLNSGHSRYFSLLYDGSSSAKTMDEKEVYVIKTCQNGKPNYQVMSLEEPENTNAAGLKAALDQSVAKQNFSFERKDRQVGNGSDGASVNNALYALEKEELGPHLIKGWCANHKAELGIHDAFKSSDINKETETVLSNIYYLFKRANLKWRLFKRQAKVLSIKCIKYKRPSGSRWISHQVDSTMSFLRNLPILLGFLHQNIISPYNKTMSDAKATLQGHLKSVSKLELLLFTAVRKDILAYLSPYSQMLESQKLLAPEAISAMKSSTRVLSRISQIMTEKGSACLYMADLFPTLSRFVWPYLQDDDSTLPVRRTRTDDTAQELADRRQMFHEYSMTSSLNTALNKVHAEVLAIVTRLEENLHQRFAEFVESPVFHAAAVLLDTKSYKFKSVDNIFDSVETIKNHFAALLEPNSCDLSKLHQELTCLHTHVTSFLSKSTNEQAWQQLFALKSDLSITNICHIIEICIVLPISSADVERVFSTFARLLTKERLSLKNQTLEHLLVLRSNDFNNYDPVMYNQVVDKFLEFHPDGKIRKHPPRLDGYAPHKRPNSSNQTITNTTERKRNCLFLSEDLALGTSDHEAANESDTNDESSQDDEYTVSESSSSTSDTDSESE